MICLHVRIDYLLLFFCDFPNECQLGIGHIGHAESKNQQQMLSLITTSEGLKYVIGERCAACSSGTRLLGEV